LNLFVINEFRLDTPANADCSNLQAKKILIVPCPSSLMLWCHTGGRFGGKGLSYWHAQAALAFLLLGIETKSRSIEEITRMRDRSEFPRGSGSWHQLPRCFDGRRTLKIGWV
jgi:hypothetical protein